MNNHDSKDNVKSDSTYQNELRLFRAALKMKESMLENAFIINAINSAFRYEGISDLILMWTEEDCEDERAEIINDIKSLLLDIS